MGKTLTERALALRPMIEKAAMTLSDEDAILAPELFITWSSDSVIYSVGDRVRYGEFLYKCLQAHTSQLSWTPGAAPSLWVRVDEPGEEWPAWRQPVGSQDAYPLDAKVSHKNKHWTSTAQNNVWEPGVYGWKET